MSRQKRAVCLLLCSLLLTSIAPRIKTYSAVNYVIYVNGVTAGWEEVGPYMRQGRLMVPLGGFGKALGAEIKWDGNKNEAFIFWQNRYAWAQVSNPTLYYGTYINGGGGQPLLTDVSPMELPLRPALEQSRMTVPLASLVEALGGSLEWNEATHSANVTIQPQLEPQPLLDGQAAEVQSNQNLRQNNSPPSRESYFSLINIDEILMKYEKDDPFVLISFDDNLQSAAMYEVLKAAADLKIKVYGLDMNKEEASVMLPFAQDLGEVTVYFVNGHERVKSIGDPDYFIAVDELIAYMEEL